MGADSQGWQSAAQQFVREIANHAYDGVTRSMIEMLLHGPPGRKPDRTQQQLQIWYSQLSRSDQLQVQALIREVALLSVFSCLVILDNKVVGQPVSGHDSDYALYVQSYEDHQARVRNSPLTATRINRSYQSDGDLHDIFTEIVRDAGRKG